MASNNAHGMLFREWESLDNACGENTDVLSDVESLRAPLVASIARVKELKDRQENLTGERKQVTQELRQAVEEGKEAARRLRVFVKARLGTKSERLTQFGTAPIRKRGSRTKAKGNKGTPPAPSEPRT
jgi:hypothetical protein